MVTRFLRSALVLVFFILQVSCGNTGNKGADKQADSLTTADVEPPQDSVIVQYAGADSASVFDLLQKNCAVDYKSTSMGVFVNAIDSVENGDNHYWFYSVNDTMGQVASDKYVTQTGDTIRWHFRKVGK